MRLNGTLKIPIQGAERWRVACVQFIVEDHRKRAMRRIGPPPFATHQPPTSGFAHCGIRAMSSDFCVLWLVSSVRFRIAPFLKGAIAYAVQVAVNQLQFKRLPGCACLARHGKKRYAILHRFVIKEPASADIRARRDHDLCRHLAAIPAATSPFHDHHAEQAMGKLPAIALSAGRRAMGKDQMRARTIRAEPVNAAFFGSERHETLAC
ncbi:MAG: hypothetical protein ING12_10030 [Roseomonas sp.]|nr:hypothetical protein [Roseomonas sp.]